MRTYTPTPRSPLTLAIEREIKAGRKFAEIAKQFEVTRQWVFTCAKRLKRR